ncbi:MAG: hypothetical protein CMM52_10825 [Rhodospirillaceae bacterium]|nr:hypothetical protein [Rhodospirillaceae bacterium]|tara:strand:+ start:7197 stop:7421 length:225 start_codon:yes stop_codon:yes gene_type:complete
MTDTHGESGTVLGADEVALVIDAEGVATLCLPDYDDDDEVPRHTLFLVALMNKMQDEDWVDEIISEIVPEISES